jgi:hypothetical protein
MDGAAPVGKQRFPQSSAFRFHPACYPHLSSRIPGSTITRLGNKLKLVVGMPKIIIAEEEILSL